MTDLYCLPGTMCDERLWQSLQDAMVGTHLHHQAIPMESTLDKILTELARVLPNESINLLGFSMGGYLAAAFALRFPARVKRLIIVSNLACGLPPNEKQQRLVALNWISKQGYSGIPRKKAQAMLGQSSSQNEDLIALIQAMDNSLGEKVLVQQLTASLERPDLLPELAQSSFDTTFVIGSEDGLVDTQDRQRVNAISQCQLIEIAKVGHMLPLECPRPLARIIEDALLVP